MWESIPEYIELTSIEKRSRGREYTQVHVPVYGCMQTGRVEEGHRDLHIPVFARLQSNMWKVPCILHKRAATESGARARAEAGGFQFLCYCLLHQVTAEN